MALSLPDSVKEIRDEMDRSAPSALTEFNERMIRAGYLEIDAAMYSGFRFILHISAMVRVVSAIFRA